MDVIWDRVEVREVQAIPRTLTLTHLDHLMLFVCVAWSCCCCVGCRPLALGVWPIRNAYRYTLFYVHGSAINIKKGVVNVVLVDAVWQEVLLRTRTEWVRCAVLCRTHGVHQYDRVVESSSRRFYTSCFSNASVMRVYYSCHHHHRPTHTHTPAPIIIIIRFHARACVCVRVPLLRSCAACWCWSV